MNGGPSKALENATRRALPTAGSLIPEEATVEEESPSDQDFTDRKSGSEEKIAERLFKPPTQGISIRMSVFLGASANHCKTIRKKKKR